jgi:polyferredoxin
MDKMGYPRGLIRYTTQNSLQGKGTRVLRPRIVVYGLLLGALFAGFVVALANRAALHLDVLRDRNALYRELPDGGIENVYQLKIINKDDKARVVRVTIGGLPGARVETAPANPELAPGGVLDVVARVSTGRENAPPGGSNVTFRLESVTDGTVGAERTARFMAPVN